MTRAAIYNRLHSVVEMSTIENDSREELALRWSTLFSETIPKNMSTTLLRRAVGHWLQQKTRPGLRKVTRQYLRHVVAPPLNSGSVARATPVTSTIESLRLHNSGRCSWLCRRHLNRWRRGPG
jgi:hypothetical protein